MRKSASLISVVFLLSLALPAFAQEKPGTIGRVFVIQPKPGMAQKYEEGRKRHMEWHKKQNDTWAWETWQVEAGDAFGTYITLTLGHNWKDFDTWEAKYGKADAADADANMGPYIGAETNGFWTFLANVSRPAEGNEPPRMIAVIHFIPKIDAVRDFDTAIHRIHEAILKTNWPPRYEWYVLASGGEQPHFALVLPRNSWADMAPPEVSFQAMLEKAYGKAEAESLSQSLDKSIKREWSETLVYRPDLSYRPAAK